jgi:opacity protein-like surface antigen
LPFTEPPGFYATVGAVLTPAVEQQFSTTAPNGTSLSTTSAIGAGLGSEAGLGYDFGKARAEITAIYNPRSVNSTTVDLPLPLGPKTFQLDDVSIKTTSLMVSGYRDIPIIRNKLEAYLGGGIGVRYTTIDAFSLTPVPGITIPVPSDYDTNFGYQAKLGLTYKVKKKLDLFAEAVYAGTVTSSEGNLGILGVRIGTRRRF